MKEKGIEEYLDVAELFKKNKDLEFRILGSFEEEKYKEVIKNNKSLNITYLGTSSDVRNEIRKADCVINPSYHEGMSNVLLEGAAMGKPLLASNISGCKEIIDEGQNGFLFDVKSSVALKKAITKFLNLSEEEKEKMGRRSRKKVVNEFDREIVVDNYIKVIKNILEE